MLPSNCVLATASSGGHFFVPRQLYQSSSPYRGYQKIDEKGLYQIDKDLVKGQPKGFYTIFDDVSKDVTYSDKDFKKIAVNFVGIKTSYSKYRATFPSRSKLYHHLRSNCQEVTSHFFPAKATFPIPIIASKAVH